jgi:hypothetical protein
MLVTPELLPSNCQCVYYSPKQRTARKGRLYDFCGSLDCRDQDYVAEIIVNQSTIPHNMTSVRNINERFFGFYYRICGLQRGGVSSVMESSVGGVNRGRNDDGRAPGRGETWLERDAVNRDW